jgi:hypothetical protein
MEEINYEEFFKREFENRYMIDIPCEDIEDGCVDNEEGTLVRGYEKEYRIMIYIINDEEIALFVEEPDENHLLFSMGHDIFKGMTRDAIPYPVIGLYPDDVVIFSEGKEILASSDMNIGQVISAVIKEQERLLSKDLERAYLEQFLKMKDLKGKENSKMEGDIQ